MIPTVFQVAFGGAAGSVARYGVNVLAARVLPGYPLGTFFVNITGSFLIGIMAALFAMRGGQHLAPLAITGFLGGYTTFSAFSLDTITLLERGAGVSAFFYVALSVLLSLAMVWTGLAFGREVFA